MFAMSDPSSRAYVSPNTENRFEPLTHEPPSQPTDPPDNPVQFVDTLITGTWIRRNLAGFELLKSYQQHITASLLASIDDGSAKRIRDHLYAGRGNVDVRKRKGLPIRRELMRLLTVRIPDIDAEESSEERRSVCPRWGS